MTLLPRKNWVWGIVLLGLLLTGCLNLNKTYPEIKYFALEVSRPAAPLSPMAGTRLKVRRLAIAPRYEGKELVYRTSDVEYRSDFYHQWFIPPRAILTEQVSQWLRESQLFEHVIDVSSYMEPTHFFEGTITAMYGDFQDPSKPEAIFEVQAFLLKEDTDIPVIQFQRDYKQHILLSDSSPHSLVKGWNEALHEVLSQLERDLHQTLLQ